MIPCPPGWREWRVGDSLRYASKDAGCRCVLTYDERLTPVRSLTKLTRAALAEEPDFVATQEHHIVRLITHEGEYGAFVQVRGRSLDERPAVVSVAAIFTEHFNTSLVARIEGDHRDGDAHVEQMTQLLLEVTQLDSLGLGQRRRRVGFTPPRNWHPIPGLGLDMVLLPPDYPKTHGSITVYPAEPLELAVDPIRVQRDHDQRVGLPPPVAEERSMARTRQTKRNLALLGEEYTSRRVLPGNQGEMVRHLVVLRDDHYVYATKLEALRGPRMEQLRADFIDMMGSIESIPQVSADARVFDIWND
jgi:hypothetical protein